MEYWYNYIRILVKSHENQPKLDRNSITIAQTLKDEDEKAKKDRMDFTLTDHLRQLPQEKLPAHENWAIKESKSCLQEDFDAGGDKDLCASQDSSPEAGGEVPEHIQHHLSYITSHQEKCSPWSSKAIVIVTKGKGLSIFDQHRDRIEKYNGRRGKNWAL